jgi:magnesium chelatase subunit I
MYTADTLGALKASGYQSKTVKEEIRENLKKRLVDNKPSFEGIYGYEHTVIPDIETALLSKHNILLLGLRGQAKTRIARSITDLLDEHIPIVKGSEINDDPFAPISVYAKNLIKEMKDETPIEWIHRSARFAEKLATPDVSVADLIGDIDPIKAANQKLQFSSEEIIHFGLVPRSNRGIFVINELPDLQQRIQVALLNILQEGDIQIRGFKTPLLLDVLFVFTANPEDYTNRGSIITPLKDRIESQILTHYPPSIEISKQITTHEARLNAVAEHIYIPEIAKDLIEMIAIEARENEYVNDKSGVSARLTISAFENLISQVERRMLLNGEQNSSVRIADFWSVLPSITGKIELVYEGEQEGQLKVSQILLSRAIKRLFLNYFPNPEKLKKQKKPSPYENLQAWFAEGNGLNLTKDASDKAYSDALKSVKALASLTALASKKLSKEENHFYQELILFGLSECSVLNKKIMITGFEFNDLFSSYLNGSGFGKEEDFFNS